MVQRFELQCRHCGQIAVFEMSDNGFFYCDFCGAQSDDLFTTDFFDVGNLRSSYCISSSDSELSSDSKRLRRYCDFDEDDDDDDDDDVFSDEQLISDLDDDDDDVVSDVTPPSDEQLLSDLDDNNINSDVYVPTELSITDFGSSEKNVSVQKPSNRASAEPVELVKNRDEIIECQDKDEVQD